MSLTSPLLLRFTPPPPPSPSQAVASLMSPDHLLGLVLDRFKLREWALLSSPVLGTNPDAATRLLCMMEECLRFLIDLVTFTPAQPQWVQGTTEVGCAVRRLLSLCVQRLRMRMCPLPPRPLSDATST